MLRKFIFYSTLISLILSVVGIVLMLKKPLVPPVEASAAALKSCEDKLANLVQAQQQGTPTEVRLTSEELNSEIQKSIAGAPQPPGAARLKEATVYMQGDQLVGVFDVEMKGVDLYLTVRGGLTLSQHAARLLPDQVKLGSLPVPVSWLEGKLNMETPVPDFVTGLRIENGEMVVQAQ